MKEKRRFENPIYKRVILFFVAAVIVISAITLYNDYLSVRNEGIQFDEDNLRIHSDYDYRQRVLVISSSAPTQFQGVEEANGIYSVLSKSNIGYSIEYMNDNEMGDLDTHKDNFYAIIKEHVNYHKDYEQPFSAIMAGGDAALRFCMDHKQELFSNVPIVFYGVNDIDYAKECVSDPNVCGNIEKIYLRETIDLARALRPNADEIIMIHDLTDEDRADWRMLQNLAPEYPKYKISDINTGQMTTEAFCETIENLNEKAIVLCSHAQKDSAHHTFSTVKRFKMIAEHCNVPVFTCYMEAIGNGATAGDVVYARDCSMEAAETVVQVLTGAKPVSTFSLQSNPTHRTAADREMIKKFQLNFGALPEDTTMVNDASQYMREYQAVFISFGIIVLGLLVVLGVLFYEYKILGVHISREKQAEDASNAKSTFLFNLSHDIRTPMNAIIGFTDLALKNTSDKKKVEEYVGKVKVSGEYMLNLLNDVLEMARIESGKLEIDEAPMDLFNELDHIKSLVDDSAAKKNLTLDFRNKNIVNNVIYGDELHLRQIAMNLLSNSLKYTKDGGTITYIQEELPYDREGFGLYRITVADTGIGMSNEFIGHIFETFERERNATTDGVQGTGLGMSIVKRLTDAMGGEITIDSELGKGTTVTVTTPLRIANQSTVKYSEEDEEVFDLNGTHALLAEDNDLNREIAVELLQENGIVVDAVEDGSEAVDKVIEKEPGTYDFILMDIQMPYMDGYKATETIRRLEDKQRASIPIIALTANAFLEDKQKAAIAGMNAHIAKPIDINVLCSVIGNVLRYRDYRIDNIALSEFKEKYHDLGCPCGYFVYRAEDDENILYVDDATMTIFGCDTKSEFMELVGGSFKGIVHPDDLDAIEDEIVRQQKASDKALDYIAYRIIRRDGKVREAVDIGYKVFNGEEWLFYVYIADVTDLKEKE